MLNSFQSRVSFILTAIDHNIKRMFEFYEKGAMSTVTWYSVQRDELEFTAHVGIYRDGKWVTEVDFANLDISAVNSIDWALTFEQNVWNAVHDTANRITVS
jgi:hypothetical protein